MRRIIYLSILMMSLYACSEQRPPNKTGEFKLHDGESTQLFTMPKELKIEQQSQSRLFFVLAYPSMTGRDPQRVPQRDEISVWISLEDRIGSTESLVKRPLKKLICRDLGKFIAMDARVSGRRGGRVDASCKARLSSAKTGLMGLDE